MLDAIRERFTPATVWENVGLAITTGADEAIGLRRKLEETSGTHGVEIDILAIAPDGAELGAFKVMGIFEIDGDKIAWRDYFDSAAAKESMAA